MAVTTDAEGSHIADPPTVPAHVVHSNRFVRGLKSRLDRRLPARDAAIIAAAAVQVRFEHAGPTDDSEREFDPGEPDGFFVLNDSIYGAQAGLHAGRRPRGRGVRQMAHGQ